MQFNKLSTNSIHQSQRYSPSNERLKMPHIFNLIHFDKNLHFNLLQKKKKFYRLTSEIHFLMLKYQV